MSTEQAPRFKAPANWYNYASGGQGAGVGIPQVVSPPLPPKPAVVWPKTIWEAILTLNDVEAPPPQIPLTAIKAAVCAYFEIPRAELEGSGQYGRLAVARRVYLYLGMKHTKNSIAELGRRINKHHTSMLFAQKIVADRPQDYSQAISEIEAKLGVGK